MSVNTTSFEDIEHQKENIQPIREGHSASSLAQTFGKNALEARSEHDSAREEFEKQIQDSSELDDPIEPYLDYIKWIGKEFPQGNTVESGLVQVLERCTSDFRDAQFYRNDSRYLKVWLQYIKFSDSPKEVFIYLSRKSIGLGLATYYEEYAAYLESIGRRTQANEVYELGLEANARPVERLRRRYNEYLERLHAQPPDPNEPSSPVMPLVRPALAQKDGATIEGEEKDDDGHLKPKKKLQIFADTSDSKSAVNTGGWDSIGSLAMRKKENTMEARPWAGEKLAQDSETKSSKTLSVFRDISMPSAPGKRAERIAVALDFLQVDGEEFCLEEVLARVRRIYHKVYPRPHPDDSHAPLKGGDSPAKAPRSPTMTMYTKAATEEVFEMFNKPLEEDDSDGAIDDAYDVEYTETRGYDNLGMDNIVTQTNELTFNEQTDKSVVPQTPAREPLKYALPAMTPIAEATETLTQHTLAASMLNGEPLLNDALVNPASADVQLYILHRLDPGLDTYDNYHRYKGVNFERGEVIKRCLRRNQDVTIDFPTGESFVINKVLGTGGYGTVYLAVNEMGDLRALKIQEEMNPWEFYILRSLRQRLLKSREIDSIVHTNGQFVYDDESWMSMHYYHQGTMLDLANIARSKNDGNGLEECLALFFSIELLRVLEALHSTGIIHCDIKPDNVMLRLNPLADHEWSKYYAADGSNGWSHVGLSLIDFGRAADITLLNPNVQFTADWKMDDQDCPKMREREPWTYHADYHGTAVVIHMMLFGRHLTTVEDSDGMHKLTSQFKRYWQRDLWEEVFSVLLNPEFHGNLPITPVIADCHRKLAVQLEKICEFEGVSLKRSLQQLTSYFDEKRPRSR